MNEFACTTVQEWGSPTHKSVQMAHVTSVTCPPGCCKSSASTNRHSAAHNARHVWVKVCSGTRRTPHGSRHTYKALTAVNIQPATVLPNLWTADPSRPPGNRSKIPQSPRIHISSLLQIALSSTGFLFYY